MCNHDACIPRKCTKNVHHPRGGGVHGAYQGRSDFCNSFEPRELCVIRARKYMPRLSLRADAGVGAVAVSPTSRDAVLAGRSGLYIVDLNDPFTLPRWLPLRSAWEVASVQWCPHPNRPACLVSSSNQKVLVWNLALPSEKAIEHVLHGHRRAVTDVSFSALDTNVFATSSIDTTIRLWDLRNLSSASLTFADFGAGVMQCRWDPTNEHQVATAQASRVTIWDKRKANRHVVQLDAHDGECNTLQYFGNGHIITGSTDRTVKVWDLKRNSSKPRVEVRTDFPVWRALPTPYEYGAFLVPLRGGQNRVSLVNLAHQSGTQEFNSVQIGYFEHPQEVRSALIMRTDLSPSNYDVVTWCSDLQLREWRGEMLQQLPHATMGTGCKDDPPRPLATTASYNTDEFDRKFHNLHGAGKEVFDLPILNRRHKDSAHALSQFDWIAGVHISKTGGGIGHAGGPTAMAAAAAAAAATSATGATGGEGSGSGSGSGSGLENSVSAGGAASTDADSGSSSSSTHGPESSNHNDGSTASQTFSQEIISVAARLPRVLFDDINIGARTCVLSLFGPWGPEGAVINLRVDVRAPSRYPNQPLECDLYEETLDLSADKFEEISEFLFKAALEFSRHKLQSLEFCVRYLVGDPVSLSDQLSKGDADVVPMTDIQESLRDSCVPLIGPGRERENVGSAATDVITGGGGATSSNEDDNSEPQAYLLPEIDGVLTLGRIGVRSSGTSTNFSSHRLGDDLESNNMSELSSMGDDLDVEFVDDAVVDANVEGEVDDTGNVGESQEKENIIDSTPLPKSCGGVWSVTGQLICFFNHKPARKERGPLPLDKVFADDNNSNTSDAPFLSDDEDFEAFVPPSNPVNNLLETSNWAFTAARLNAAAASSGAYSSTGSHHHQQLTKRPRTRTITTATSEDGPRSVSAMLTAPFASTHTVVVHNMLHLWPCRPDLAEEYEVSRGLEPLEMSKHNLEVALKFNLTMHVHVWKMLIEHVTSECLAFSDPYYALASAHLRFDWSGASVGIGSFLPELTTELEQKGEFQLLVGISMVLSALRAQCEVLKQEAIRKAGSGIRTAPTMYSDVETYFYANSENVTMLEQPEEIPSEKFIVGTPSRTPTQSRATPIRSTSRKIKQRPKLQRHGTSNIFNSFFADVSAESPDVLQPHSLPQPNLQYPLQQQQQQHHHHQQHQHQQQQYLYYQQQQQLQSPLYQPQLQHQTQAQQQTWPPLQHSQSQPQLNANSHQPHTPLEYSNTLPSSASIASSSSVATAMTNATTMMPAAAGSAFVSSSGATMTGSEEYSNADRGFYFSFQISDTALFDFPYPQSSSTVYARPKDRVTQSFNEHIPRLVKHRRIYASLLHTWGLSMQRAEVIKPNYLDPLVSQLNIVVENEPQGVEITLNETACAYCDQPVTKTFEFCGNCHHVLHCSCAQMWWGEDSECPAACGCECKRIS